MPPTRTNYLLLLALLVCIPAPARGDDGTIRLSLFGGRMTTNVWEETFNPAELEFADAYLLGLGLTRRLGGYRDLLSYEIEGQVVKHFRRQHHWEFNALATLRWERFWWDERLDTSLAFGLGPSYASEIPEIEVETDGESQRWLVYWLLELAFRHPAVPRYELFTRIHHRSGAYGLVADEGGGNALVLGVRFPFH